MTPPYDLNAESLRAMAADQLPRWFTFDAAGLRCLADMLEIADSTARSDIECNLPYEGEGAAIWYDTRLIPNRHGAELEQALRYLEARGQLTHKPDAPHWIRPWGPDGP